MDSSGGGGSSNDQYQQHLQRTTTSQNSSTCGTPNSDSGGLPAVSGNLDNVVVTHMLQLPGLTVDMISQSVRENRYDHIYAIYNLLVDKLQAKRKEQQRLQHHANLAYSR